MTLDEAIKHCEDVVRFNEMYCDAEDSVSDRVKCAADHRQLAEWLKELQRYREQERKQALCSYDLDEWYEYLLDRS